MTALAPDAGRIAAVRRFNRFYTQHVGVLRDGYLDSPFSLTEARVLFEVRQRGNTTATEIGRDLGLDAGYLSRILGHFEKSGLIRKEGSPSDGRQSFLSITAVGRKAMELLERRTVRQVGDVLHRLSDPEQDRLVTAMRTVERMIAAEPAAKPEIVLRQPRPGDLGWVVARHGDPLRRGIRLGRKLRRPVRPDRRRFRRQARPGARTLLDRRADGENVGSVFLVKDSDKVARLRLLLVDPVARGPASARG